MSEAGETKYRPSKKTAQYLDQLKGMELYGKNRTEVVRTVIRDHILVLLERGVLKRIED